MPKENTHLFFAMELIDGFPAELKALVKENSGFFYLGAIAPDIFFYGLKSDRQASASLHGKDGQPTNKIIFDLLRQAKKAKDEKSLVFILGYLSHCVLDIVFHPVIIYLTGDIFNKNNGISRRATYSHRKYETALDEKVNKICFFNRLVKRKLLEDTAYPEYVEKEFNLPKGRTVFLAKRQSIINYLLRSRTVYYLLFALVKLGIYKENQDLAISYFHLNSRRRIKTDKINYRDFLTGEQKRTSIEELFSQAKIIGQKRTKACWDFFLGKINEAELKKLVPGESLETGRANCPVSAIKYFNS